MTFVLTFGTSIFQISRSVCAFILWIYHSTNGSTDIVDIKPANMEELTEVITAAEFHPTQCNVFMYSSSKSNIKLADMRDSALCDRHAKSVYPRPALSSQTDHFVMQCLKKKRTRLTAPSSPKLSRQSLTSSSATMEGTYSRGTTCLSRSGMSTWSRSR